MVGLDPVAQASTVVKIVLKQSDQQVDSIKTSGEFCFQVRTEALRRVHDY